MVSDVQVVCARSALVLCLQWLVQMKCWAPHIPRMNWQKSRIGKRHGSEKNR